MTRKPRLRVNRSSWLADLASLASLGLLLLLLVGLSGCSPGPSPDSGSDRQSQVEAEQNRSSVNQRMAGTPDPGFARVTEPRPFVFPADHGAHPEYATEWWYFTGNLEDVDGRRFGYQFTLFRIGLKPTPEKDLEPDLATAVSPWRSNQLYMGHLAVSDFDKQRHFSEERFARPVLDMAGATIAPLKVWLGPWQLDAKVKANPNDNSDSFFPAQLSAQGKDAQGETFAINLTLQAGNKPRVLQGDRGFSRKGPGDGDASYYYSYTRLPTQGTVQLGDRQYQVSGNSWFDREWSSSALADDQDGWDWFALQLEDGRDLMFYRMRGIDGQAQSFSQGVLVGTDGQVMRLGLHNTQATPLEYWTSQDGVSYPVDWLLELPELAMTLKVRAVFNEQTMHHTVRYWEGAVVVSGSHAGRGYLEMSGYD